MWHWKGFSSQVWLVISLLSLVSLAVACGAAATPAPTPKAAPAPTLVGVAAPTPIPTVAAVPTAAPKAAPTPAPVPAPAAKVHPGKLTIMMGDLGGEQFDATFATGGATLNYSRMVHGFLIADNERREMVPGIASQWGLSADGLTWTFTIRKGVRWHDGSELTPQDVLWTLQHSFGPQAHEYASLGTAGRISRLMDKIELSGPDKVSLTTKRPVTDFDFVVAEAGTQWYTILPKRAKLHDKEEELAYDNNPIGTGFMRLVRRVPGYVMKFERFDDFYYQPKNGLPEDKRVNFKSLDLFLVPEEGTRVAAVRAGEADLVPTSLATKKQVEAGGGRLVFGQEGVIVGPKLMGCWEPQPCRDKRVRHALDYAIDKEVIRDRLYGGPQVFQVKGWYAITPSTIGYTPALDPWPFDPGKARQLLADAGYPGGKGFGKLVVNVQTSTVLPFLVEGAQLAADNWRRELGLDVEIRVLDSVAARRRQDAGELNGQVLWRDNDTKTEATNSAANIYGDPKNLGRMHQDPELFRLTQQTVQTVDPDKRAEASKQLWLRLREENYHLGIGYLNIPWGVGPRVLAWRPYPLTLYPSGLHTITLK